MRRSAFPKLMLIWLMIFCFAVPVGAWSPKVIGHVLSTDIRAFIDGVEIPAYNIDGYMVVKTSDIREYGFRVTYNNNARTSTVSMDDSYTVWNPVKDIRRYTTIGVKLDDVYESDIAVFIGGRKVRAYNVNGYMAFRFSDLRVFGTYAFDNKTRTASLIVNRPAAQTKKQADFSLPDFILHAGGITSKKQIGSNSIEALNKSYKDGYRVMEIDFCFTRDGELACVHDWNSFYPQPDGKPPTMETFMKQRASVYGYTSLTADTLAAWLSEHRDAYIVTDSKEDNLRFAKKIAGEYPELLDRFIVQIYAAAEYRPVKALGFDKIIFTLYQLPYRDKFDVTALTEFVRANPGLLALTIAAAPETVSLVRTLSSATDVPIFVHTVNKKAVMTEWQSYGAAGVYADYPPAG